jgi:hypothetical protein
MSFNAKGFGEPTQKGLANARVGYHDFVQQEQMQKYAVVVRSVPSRVLEPLGHLAAIRQRPTAFRCPLA